MTALARLVEQPESARLMKERRPSPTRWGTRGLLRVVGLAQEIQATPAKEAGALGYMARVLIQTSLPHRDPGDVAAWTRQNGNFILQISPGTTVGVQPARRLGIPFGVYPRLILAHVTREALLTRSPRIRLGKNLSDAMERVGPLHRTGGAEGTIARFKEQLTRLARAEISWTYCEGDRVVSAGIKPFEGIDGSWAVDPSMPFISELVLNERLFDEILRSSVPLDMRVVRELARQRSSLAIDLYAWLTHRQYMLQRTGKAARVPWKGLEEQFGGDYGRTRDFRRHFVAALRVVGALFPEARATPDSRGLLLRPGRPHVSARLPAWRPRWQDSAENSQLPASNYS